MIKEEHYLNTSFFFLISIPSDVPLLEFGQCNLSACHRVVPASPRATQISQTAPMGISSAMFA